MRFLRLYPSSSNTFTILINEVSSSLSLLFEHIHHRYSCPAGSRGTFPTTTDKRQACYLCPAGSFSETRFFFTPGKETGNGSSSLCDTCAFPYAPTGASPSLMGRGGYTKCEVSRPFVVGISLALLFLILLFIAYHVCRRVKV